jgi:hypothetical protein
MAAVKGPNVIQFPNAAKIYGTDKNIIAEVIRITPTDAAAWLRCNRNNRPVRKRHVEFLASEIIAGNWQVNGQAIVIAEDEQILDGQHRLLAIIEAGQSIQSLVVYGITPEAFKTIDTGAVRTGADALCLHFHDTPPNMIKAVAAAVQWCIRLENHSLHYRTHTSNTDVIAYVKAHMRLLQCAETLSGYPRTARPLPWSTCTALYEMFSRKHEAMADKFMQRFCTGEEIVRTDPEYILRGAFIRDAERVAKFPLATRVHMVIKGWNWLRRGNTEANARTIAVQPSDDQKIKIY